MGDVFTSRFQNVGAVPYNSTHQTICTYKKTGEYIFCFAKPSHYRRVTTVMKKDAQTTFNGELSLLWVF